MNYFVFGTGILLLTAAATDLINTALSARGAGFLSKRLSKFIWKVLLATSKNTGTRKVLEMGGAIILVSILINWLMLIWLSASLLFISKSDSLINVETNTPTTLVSKIFFTGYTLSTLGLGDIEPKGPFWEILTAIISFAGLILISIAITYLIPVVSAEIEKRRISVYITTMGCSIKEILLNFWDGNDFKGLTIPFQNLTSMIILHAQNHKAYSVLHFFHTSNKKEAFVLNITNLDEVLTILLHHVPESIRPQATVLMALRKAVSSYLLTLPSAFITPGDEIPPVLQIGELEKEGIPMVRSEQIESNYENLIDRRRLLLSLIKDDGWQWKDLEAGAYDHLIRAIHG